MVKKNYKELFKSVLLVSFLILISSFIVYSTPLFEEDFGTSSGNISTAKWPTACRGGSPPSTNSELGACAASGDFNYALSGFIQYITSQSIAIPSAGYDLTFEYSFNLTFSFPKVEIRTGGSCGTTLLSTTILTNTSGSCNPETVNLDSYSGQTIFIRFVSSTSTTSFYIDDILVDDGSLPPPPLFEEDFGTSSGNISTAKWPTACRGGSPPSTNSELGACAASGDFNYALSGFKYITSQSIAIPSAGYDLTFEYSFNLTFSFPKVEIRTGGSCGTTLLSTTILTNTSGSCNPETVNLDSYSGQTIFIRFVSSTFTASFYIDDILVDGGGGGSGDYKWADNFNDNDLVLDYDGNDGDEDCPGCGDWVLNSGAALALVPSGGWNGNSNTTEAFPVSMANVYYVKLNRGESIESPTIDLSGKSSLKISFYAKSSSPGVGGGDQWSFFSDHLRLQFWEGSSWITVKDISEGASASEDQITPALPFNYFCFTVYNDVSAPGNHYYTSFPNVNPAYFHADFKFRVVFEGGFSGAPFAWVDDFTFRADADGYSTMIPCGVSFWNEPAATSFGHDTGTSGNYNAEKGVELELDNSINSPPNWSAEADDGDQVGQIFGLNEVEKVVFSVISEQEINSPHPVVHFYDQSIGYQMSVMSIDNSYTGPGWHYYAVEEISCDLAGGKISEPTDDYSYYFEFEFGPEFIPVFYVLNTSGIETGAGVTSSFEEFNAPDLTSTNQCAVLPVELIDFRATLQNEKVLLNWRTASEQNNKGFYVERTADLRCWETLGFVEGKGTIMEENHYSFLDKNLILGKGYYRLRQVDFDGGYEYSKVLTIDMDLIESSFKISPNPVFDGFATLHLSLYNENSGLLEIYDLNGKMVYSQDVPSNGVEKMRMEVDVQHLPSGIYTVNFHNGSLLYSEKLIIISLQ